MTTAFDVVHRLKGDAANDDLFGALILRDVRLVKWAGDVSGEGSIRRVALAPALAGYSRNTGQITCRFDQEVTIQGRDDVLLSQITAAVVVDFHAGPGGDGRVDDITDSQIRDVLVPSAWEIAYPYVREAVHTMSTRLGLDPVALGLLDPSALAPLDVHVRGVAEFRSPAAAS